VLIWSCRAYRGNDRYTSDGLVTNTMKVYDTDKNGSLNMPEFTNLAKVPSHPQQPPSDERM
jgi:Ca2+-binding EF-hand superfamily protein